MDQYYTLGPWGSGQWQDTPWNAWAPQLPWVVGNSGTATGSEGQKNNKPWWKTPGGTPPASPSFYFPTAQESYSWASKLPEVAAQRSLLSQAATPGNFQAAVLPYINQVMRAIGRSGLPSSSYADRLIANTLGSLWAQNLYNQVGSWQNLLGGIGSMMPQFWAPQATILPYLLG